MNHTPIRVTAVLLLAGLATACGGGDDDTTSSQETTTTEADAEGFTVQVASYDLAADAPQRFIVGLLAEEGGLVVGGEVEMAFTFQGTGQPSAADEPMGDPEIDGITGKFITVADGTDPGDGPKVLSGAEGVGVYEARDITFGKAGFWEVTVTAEFDGKRSSVPGAFQVLDTALVPAAGDPAPRTENLLVGAPGAPVEAIDSRAEEDGSVPDPQLHELTVAQAIATGKPTVVVISTPVFCVSRFCGPITDAVDAMATEYGDRANFVHIEVWRDFEGKALNKGAAEWIYLTPEAGGAEPWVFLVDGAGTIVERWDNVTNGRALRTALDAVA